MKMVKGLSCFVPDSGRKGEEGVAKIDRSYLIGDWCLFLAFNHSAFLAVSVNMFCVVLAFCFSLPFSRRHRCFRRLSMFSLVVSFSPPFLCSVFSSCSAHSILFYCLLHLSSFFSPRVSVFFALSTPILWIMSRAQSLAFDLMCDNSSIN